MRLMYVILKTIELQSMLLQQNAYQEQISRTIYIGNLHTSVLAISSFYVQINEQQLMDVFGSCGIINVAKVASEGMGLKANAGISTVLYFYEQEQNLDLLNMLIVKVLKLQQVQMVYCQVDVLFVQVLQMVQLFNLLLMVQVLKPCVTNHHFLESQK